MQRRRKKHREEESDLVTFLGACGVIMAPIAMRIILAFFGV